MYKRKNRNRLNLINCDFFVALEGFEPPQAEPESDVLPLHHKAIFCLTECLISIKALFPFCECKVTTYF